MEPNVQTTCCGGRTTYHMPDPALTAPPTPMPPQGNSILRDVKLGCNLMPEYTDFDQDIMDLINGVLSILVQLGVVSPSAPLVADDSLPWAAWIPDEARYGMVKLYVKYKVRLMFDPPNSEGLRSQMQSLVDECEWRGFIEADTQDYMY